GDMRIPASKFLVFTNVFGDTVTVILQDDKVVMGEGRVNGEALTLGRGDGNPPPGPDAKPKAGGDQAVSQATADGFSRVRPGMTEEQVVAWLGRPTNSYSLPGQQFGGQRLPPTKRLVWGDLFGDHVSVTLQDDKVETGEGRIDGKPVTLSPGGANPPPKAGED